ncbi:hypothetical protein LCGC14_1835340 [marine sediment metagenome]|uniref:LamG-like jellyroll fold domain-containing protein n=1 Tax=marine sediment metagenome TaxID=412755 RepID=A0A0F9H308_9ZZZZ
MIIAHYKLNDNAASATVLDATGVHNGTYKDAGGNENTSNGSTANSRGVGTCLDFDDANTEYVEIADHVDFTPVLTPFSISAWVYMHSATYFVWASKWQVGSNQEWNIFTGTTKKINFRMYDNSENASIGRSYNTSLDSYEGKWTHFVATYDGGILSSGIKIYLNGNRVDDTDSESGSFISVENLTAPVYIGRYDTKYANGLIDNVMFFNHILHEDQVKALYNGGYGTEIVAVVDIDRRIKRR